MTIRASGLDSPFDGEPNDFVVYQSQAKVAGFAALFLLGLPLMPYMFFFEALPRHDGRVVGAAFITLFGFLFLGFAFLTAVRLLFALRSLQPKPALVINDRGFLDQSKIGGGMGWVPWEDVAKLFIDPSGRSLCIRLRNEEVYWKRHPRWERLNRWLRRIDPEGATINLTPMLLPLSPTDLLEQMIKHQARHLDSQNSDRKPVHPV